MRNQTLLRTSSLPESITLEDSEGSIELATTFNDDTLNNVTERVLLTGSEKIFPVSELLEESIGLGEIRKAASDPGILYKPLSSQAFEAELVLQDATIMIIIQL